MTECELFTRQEASRAEKLSQRIARRIAIDQRRSPYRHFSLAKGPLPGLIFRAYAKEALSTQTELGAPDFSFSCPAFFMNFEHGFLGAYAAHALFTPRSADLRAASIWPALRHLDRVVFGNDECEFDLLTGIIGYGVFGFHLESRAQRDHVVKLAFDRLDAMKKIGPRGNFYWPVSPARRKLHRIKPASAAHDLGLAHGLAGVLAFFCHTSNLGIYRRRAQSNIRNIVQYFLELDPQFAWTGLPVAARIDGAQPHRPGVVGWCDGDLAIGYAIALAGRSLKQSLLIRKGVEIFLRGCSRLPEHSPRWLSLASGLTGVMTMCHRLYQVSGKAKLLQIRKSTALECLSRVERLLASADELGPPNFAHTHEFYYGLPGAGLALASTFFNIEPYWDSLLLLSTPQCRP